MPKLLLLLPMFVFLGSCSLFKKKVKEEPVEQGALVVGEVTSVHPEQGFLLFRRYSSNVPYADGFLSARSLDGRRAASLQLSPEKLGRFLTADYSKEVAAPRVGDVVVLVKSLNDTKNDITDTEKRP